MEHEDAIRTLAVERYSLGELTPEERDAFERHYFECPECWASVRRAEMFAQNARVAGKAARRDPDEPPKRPFERRFLWLAPLAAAIVAAVVLFPRPEQYDTRPIPSLTLIGAVRSAAEENVLPANRKAVISTVVNPVEGAASYRAELRGTEGRALQHWDITIVEASDTVPLPLRPLPPGGYVLVIESVDGAGRRAEITRYPFKVVAEDLSEKR